MPYGQTLGICAAPAASNQEVNMKYLHTMVRVADLDASLAFTAIISDWSK